MNAKDEFLRAINGKSIVKCATINDDEGFYQKDEDAKIVNLKVNYSKEDFESFLEKLDFNYDSGFGGQELFGTIWLKDGTWFDRGEYDGSEWWQYHKVPEIPKDLL